MPIREQNERMPTHKIARAFLAAAAATVLVGSPATTAQPEAGTSSLSDPVTLGANSASDHSLALRDATQQEPGSGGSIFQQAQGVELVGQIGGRLSAVAADDRYLYVGIGARLVVLDASEPDGAVAMGRSAPLPRRVDDGPARDLGSPVAMGRSAPLPGRVKGVALAGRYAYVSHDRGLSVIDVSDPARPTTVGESYVSGRAFGADGRLAVHGDYAYVLGGGIRVADVSDPTTPTWLGSYPKGGELGGQGLVIAGTLAYLATGGQRSPIDVDVIDLSKPENPARVSRLRLRQRNSTGDFVRAVGMVGSSLHVQGGRPTQFRIVVDVSDPAMPFVAASYPGTTVPTTAVTTIGDRVLFLEVSDPGKPVEVISSLQASSVWLAADRAYLVEDGRVRVADLSHPTRPDEGGTYRPEGQTHALGVALAGRYAYVATDRSGLRVIDVSDPRVPSEVGFFQEPSDRAFSNARSVVADNTRAYLAIHDGVSVIDVSDPTGPVEVGSLVFPYRTQTTGAIAVAGGYAYLVGGRGKDSRLDIIDVSDASALRAAASFALGLSPAPVPLAVAGPHAYILESRGSLRVPAGALHVLDVSDPENPRELTSYAIPEAVAIATSGSYAYIAAAQDGLWIVDVSDPSMPVRVSSHAWPDLVACNVATDGRYAYVLAGVGGGRGDAFSRVLDVSHPEQPREIGFYTIPASGAGCFGGARMGLAAVGDHVYVAANELGLVILQLTPPRVPL